jgi:hypothetical protein
MAGDDPGVSEEATCHEGAVPPLSLLGTQLGRARQETAQRTTLEAGNAKQLRWQQHTRPRRAAPATRRVRRQSVPVLGELVRHPPETGRLLVGQRQAQALRQAIRETLQRVAVLAQERYRRTGREPAIVVLVCCGG